MKYRPKIYFYTLLSFIPLGLVLEKNINLTPPSSVELNRPLPVEKEFLMPNFQEALTGYPVRKIIRNVEMPLSSTWTLETEPKKLLGSLSEELGILTYSLWGMDVSNTPSLNAYLKSTGPKKIGLFYTIKKDEPLEPVIRKYERLGGKRIKIFAENPINHILFLKGNELYLEHGNTLWIPDAKLPIPFLAAPVRWTRISSGFGIRRHPLSRIRRMHDGFDLVAPYKAPVYASQSGVITYAGWMGGYGNMIEIRHEKITTRYGHLSRVFVKLGQTVKKKQLIGRVGSTGISTGPHLHFEVRQNSNGKAVRPNKYLF